MKTYFNINFYFFRVRLNFSVLLWAVAFILLSKLLYDVFFEHMNYDVSKKYNEILHTDKSEIIADHFKIQHKILRLGESRVNGLVLRTSLVIFDNNLLVFIDTNSKKFRKISSINLYEENGNSITLPELYFLYQAPLKVKNLQNMRNIIKKRNILNFNLLPTSSEYFFDSFDSFDRLPSKINPISRRRTSNSVFFKSNICDHKGFPLQPDALILNIDNTKYNFRFSDKEKYLLIDFMDCHE